MIRLVLSFGVIAVVMGVSLMSHAQWPPPLPGSVWTTLHFMAFGGQVKGVDWLVAQGGDARGMTPLHLAAYRGHDDIVQTLIAAGATVDRVDESGRTALHIAAYQGYGAAIRLLLAHEASSKLKTAEGLTPLDLVRNFPGLRTLFPVDTATPVLINDVFSNAHVALRDAIQQQDTTALTALSTSDVLEALEVNQADSYGVALLHCVADHGDSVTIQALIEAGADVHVADGSSHWTPLMYAVANEYEASVQALLAAGASVQAQDATQSTALHVAMFLDHRGIQQWLIDAGANDDGKNELGHTPKMLAQMGRAYRARQYGKLGQP